MNVAHEGGPIVFAALGGFTCSICAPNSMVKGDVEAFAATKFPGVWESVDKSKMQLGVETQATPNPCNIEPGARTHWFLCWVGPR